MGRIRFELFISELQLRIRLYMLRCEAMLLSSRDTAPEDAFTEERTKEQLQREIDDLLGIITEMSRKQGPIPLKQLLNKMYSPSPS